MRVHKEKLDILSLTLYFSHTLSWWYSLLIYAPHILVLSYLGGGGVVFLGSPLLLSTMCLYIVMRFLCHYYGGACAWRVLIADCLQPFSFGSTGALDVSTVKSCEIFWISHLRSNFMPTSWSWCCYFCEIRYNYSSPWGSTISLIIAAVLLYPTYINHWYRLYYELKE